MAIRHADGDSSAFFREPKTLNLSQQPFANMDDWVLERMVREGLLVTADQIASRNGKSASDELERRRRVIVG